jgi:drug/metabolite transporter (DMT)-like permease
MEEALLELESFQTSSSLNYRDTLDGGDDSDNDQDVDQDDRYPFFAEAKTSTINIHESSLLFPQIGAGASVNIESILNTTSIALRGSAMLDMDGEKAIVATDKGKSSLPSDHRIDEEGVWRARWLLVAPAALYGTNFSLVKLLGDEMPVGVSTPLRFGFAALATLPWLVQGFVPIMNLKSKDMDHSESQLESQMGDEEADRRVMATMYGLEVGLWNSMGYVAQAVGLETTLASESAFLCSMAVVIVPLLDWVAGKRLLPRQWVGAVMALIGVAFLELGDVGAILSLNNDSGIAIPTGKVISMIQPVAFGFGFWRMEQAMDRFPKEARRMTAAQLMAVFITSVGYGLWTVGVFEPFFDESSVGAAFAGFQSSLASITTLFPWNEWATNRSLWFSLFWTGCITTALTVYMENLALESLSAAETTLIFSTEPLWGTAFAVAVMGEQMGVNSAVGAGVILMACVYSNLGVHGLQEMWMNAVTNKTTSSCERKVSVVESSSSSFLQSLQNHWPWLQTGLAGSLATWNFASNADLKPEELNEIVENLIENLVSK